MRVKKSMGVNLAKLLAPNNAHWLLIAANTLLYVILPAVLSALFLNDPSLEKLAFLGVLAISGMLIGAGLFGGFSRPVKRYSIIAIERANKGFVLLNLGIFSVIFIVIFVTAESIPIVDALMGADASALSDSRGAFLKLRSEILGVIVYIFSVYITSVAPFCVVLLFEIRSKLRVPAAIFVGCILLSLLVKAMFLNLLLPLLAYAAQRGRITNRAFISAVFAIVFGLIAMISLAGYNEKSNSADLFDINEYLSTAYEASSSVDFLIWRSIVIPMVAARDTLVVHEQLFSGHLLAGATSGTIASITGSERINMERLVFEYQYGGWSEIGNTNATFIVDAFINFGYAGVIIYGVLASLLIKILSSSRSVAMAAMAPLFAFFLVGTNLVGAILSNGYFFLFGWLAYQKFIRKILVRGGVSVSN